MKIEDIKEIIDWHKIWAENSNNFEYDYQYKQELELSKAIMELYNRYENLLQYSKYYYSGTNYSGTDYLSNYDSVNNTFCINEPKDSGSPISDSMKRNIIKATPRQISGTPVYDFLNELSLKCEEEMKDVVVINKTPQEIEECLKIINKQAKEILKGRDKD